MSCGWTINHLKEIPCAIKIGAVCVASLSRFLMWRSLAAKFET